MDETIVIHAGRPKAGSSSVQKWLKSATARELTEASITLVVAREASESDPSIDFVPYDGQGIYSGWIMGRYVREGADR